MSTQTRPRIASRMKNVHGEAAFEMLARANELERQGRSIVHLEIGEPDFDTPSAIIQSAMDWLQRGATHYPPSAGIPELREAIARRIEARHGAVVDPKQVLITPGAKMMIFSCIMSIIDPGDEVIYPNPAYPAYEAAVIMAGGTPVPVRLEESKGFRFSIDEVKSRITSRTRMIVINSPQNPTGGVLTGEDLTALAELAEEHDLLLMSDEIYSEIYYGERPASMMTHPRVFDRLIMIDGFSKTFAMTGWRLGYAVIPKDIFPTVALFVNNSVSSTATFTQKAALQAFTAETSDAVAGMVSEFQRRRDAFVDGLNAIPGIRCHRPLGAFYVFPNISALGRPSKEIADRLLTEAGVSALHGTAFGQYGEGYLRFSFANSLQNLELALDRIRGFVSRL